MTSHFMNALAQITPMLVLAGLLRPRVGSRWWIAPLVTGLFVIDAMLLNITTWASTVDIFPGRWNWEGKIAALVFALIVLSALPGEQREGVGLTATPPRRRWFALLVVSATACGFALARTVYFSEPEGLDFGTLAYQATLPGLHEELTFRGVWWVLLGAMLDPERVSEDRIPWRTLAATTVLFASVHAVDFAVDGALSIDWLYFAATSISGLSYGLLQAIGRAVWVPILVHGLVNVTIYGWQMGLLLL